MIYVCYDNEIYGNTSGQRSSVAPEGVRTTTTPQGKSQRKKDMMAIMAGYRIPYAATLSVAHRDEFPRKIRRARDARGFRFLLMLSPYPTGWKSEPEESVDLVGCVVRCGLFPLYEVFDGVRYPLDACPDGTPLEDYVSRQRRYTSVVDDLSALEAIIGEQWEYLDGMKRAFPAREDD